MLRPRSMTSRPGLGLVLLAFALFGCGGSGASDASVDAMDDAAADAMDGAAADAAPARCLAEPGQRLVVTADWLNRSLTLLSHAQLLDPGCDASDAIVRVVDLGDHPPGPIEVEITPDGTRALVSVGPGFFAGAGGSLIGSPDVPAGGGLLLVELATGTVLHEIATTHVPMGLAMHPTLELAYTANFGDATTAGSTLSIIDLSAGTETAAVEVGELPEQVAVTDDGVYGVVNLAGGSHVRFFETADPAGTLSERVETGSDPSGVAFVGDRAVVANSMAFTYSVIDFSLPSMPTVLESPRVVGGAPYGLRTIPGTSEVLMTVALSRSTLLRIDIGSTPSVVSDRIGLAGGAFPLGAAVSSDGLFAFVAHPADRTLSIVDLEAGSARGISWLDATGPTYVAVQP